MTGPRTEPESTAEGKFSPGVVPGVRGASVETCARCGHVAGSPSGCPTCGASDPLLGGSIWYDAGGESGAEMKVIRLCHTFVRSGSPSCYTRETWDRSAGAGRWAT